MARPDLHVFVNTGDGDCCSIGAAHWIHSLRYNMDMTVMLHDNYIYGLTKMQMSPTSPQGLKSNTSPRGAPLRPLNPLTVTLGVPNASFVAQAVDWIPDILYDIISAAFHHKGLSFVRIIQRCPEFLPKLLDPWVQNPDSILMLSHENGVQASPALANVYKNQQAHDPSDVHRARETASMVDQIPVGILYRDAAVPRYEDIRKATRACTPDTVQAGLEKEFDKFTVWP
jgi:2-oxoglutarate ferredoxin oxidoreductase subunit beta